MKEASIKLFQEGATDALAAYLESELKNRNESPFWADKVLPFTKAIMSVLTALKEQDMLFDPEGMKADELTPELFFRWCDFVSLKSLVFTIQKSNQAGELLRTKLDPSTCQSYKAIDLSELGAYLSRYSVNLENESLDFPIANYNLHLGVANVIKSLL